MNCTETDISNNKMQSRAGPTTSLLENVIAGKQNKSNVRGLALSLRDQLGDTEVRTSRHQCDIRIKLSFVHDSGDSRNSTTEYNRVQAFTENTIIDCDRDI